MNFEEEKLKYRKALGLKAVHLLGQTMAPKEKWYLNRTELKGPCTTYKEVGFGEAYLFISTSAGERLCLVNLTDSGVEEISLEMKVFGMRDLKISDGCNRVTVAMSLIHDPLLRCPQDAIASPPAVLESQ